MKVRSPGYSAPVLVSYLEEALYRAVASDLEDRDMKIAPQKIAEILTGLNGVPSDDFYDAYDREVARLTNLYLCATTRT